MKMSKLIYIGFTTPKKFSLTSDLICFFERTNYSHVYIRIPSESLQRDLVYQASGLQVNFDGWNQFYNRHNIIKEYKLEISNESKIKVLQFAIDNLDKPYSLLQLIGMIWVRIGKFFHKNLSNPFKNGQSAYICSELVSAVLIELGYKIERNLDNIDPIFIDEFLSKIIK